MNKTIRELNIHYYVSITIMVLLFILVLTKTINFIDFIPVSVVAERYSLGITLIAIPIALKLFANILNKFSCYNEVEAIKTYKKATFIRLYIINIVNFANITLYAMSHNKNFIWMSVVLFVVYVFCKPSKDELEYMTVNKDEQDKEEQPNE